MSTNVRMNLRMLEELVKWWLPLINQTCRVRIGRAGHREHEWNSLATVGRTRLLLVTVSWFTSG